MRACPFLGTAALAVRAAAVPAGPAARLRARGLTREPDYFGDAVYGGREKALLAAQRARDELLRRIDPDQRVRRRSAKGSRSKTGAVGVSREVYVVPREEKRLPRVVLTAAEADQILNQPNVHDLLGLRDRAILETLYSTGIRRAELVNLHLHDLDVERETLFVRLGKGKKDRIVPIGERALAWASKYLYEARPRIVVEPDCGRVFLFREGGPLAPATLTELVRDYVIASGVGKAGACHIFRHTMATLMLEGGADVGFIQEMLGHANLQTTEIYTHVSIQKLKAIHDATHPGAKLRPAAGRAAEVKTEAERAALPQAFDTEVDESD